MTFRERLLHVLALDFAILIAIIGGWFLFVMVGSDTHFVDLGREQNLIKLAVGIVSWLVLYAQHVRTTGNWEPPDPPVTRSPIVPPTPPQSEKP